MLGSYDRIRKLCSAIAKCTTDADANFHLNSSVIVSPDLFHGYVIIAHEITIQSQAAKRKAKYFHPKVKSKKAFT